MALACLLRVPTLSPAFTTSTKESCVALGGSVTCCHQASLVQSKLKITEEVYSPHPRPGLMHVCAC